jgi:hypothetical protein
VQDDSIAKIEQEFGKPHPKAPAALAQFAFLIGRWRCEARLKSEDGEWQTFNATWVGRYVLDGYQIADEYRMISSSGELIVFGVNFRAYDAARKTWNMKWLDAVAGTWTDLGPEDLGGVSLAGRSIVYCLKEPLAVHSYTRATYTPISKTHWTWRGERSGDRKVWSEFMVIEAQRSKQ